MLRKFGKFLAVGLPNLSLVALLVVLIRLNLDPLALVLLIVSKWQILLVAPRAWWRNLRVSGYEMIVSLSALSALVLFNNDWKIQGTIGVLYWLWLVFLKPKSGEYWVALQASVCQFSGLGILFLLGRTLPEAFVLILAGIIALTAADHFLSVHNDPARGILAGVWALMVVQVSWLLWRWLIVYTLFDGRVLLPQAPIIISSLAYVIGNIYLAHSQKKLRKKILVEYLAIGAAVIAVLLIGTNWDTSL